MQRFIKNNLFWEIDYIPDINEIIIHFGKIGKHGEKGTIHMIYEGYDGDEGYQSVEQQINIKTAEGYTEVLRINNKYNLYDHYTTINKIC